MVFNPGKDWSKESDSLFIHKDGTRIAKTTYQTRPGWFVMWVDLDMPVLEFPATDDGRTQAFDGYASGGPPKKKVAAPKVKKKPLPDPDDDAPKKVDDDDEDADDDDDKEPPEKEKAEVD